MEKQFMLESIGRRINLLFRLSTRYLRQEMKKIGIGAGDYSFLAIAYNFPGSSQDEISMYMHVDKSYTARSVARLEKLGLLKREPDPKEHRIKRVFPTQKAIEMTNDFFDILKNWQGVLLKDFDPGEAQIMRNRLDKMLGNAKMCLDGDKTDPITRKIS